jgi:hypothetical protein
LPKQLLLERRGILVAIIEWYKNRERLEKDEVWIHAYTRNFWVDDFILKKVGKQFIIKCYSLMKVSFIILIIL